MTACPDASVLQELLEGALPEDTQAEVTVHLESCAQCRTVLEKLATDGKSFSELAGHLKHSPTVPEPGLQQVLDQAASAADPVATQAEVTAEVARELPFLTPSGKPGHLG